jgi:hypothetical protein
MGDSEFVNADWQLATGFALGRTRRSKKEHGVVVDVFQSPLESVISNPYFDLRYYWNVEKTSPTVEALQRDPHIRSGGFGIDRPSRRRIRCRRHSSTSKKWSAPRSGK